MNPLPTSDIPSDIVMRITTAADQLYEESGRSSFPNVDTVRRRARADMNATSTVMRSWRRAQTAAAAPLQAAIPDAVQLASQTLLTAVWVAANNSANANLQAAQAGWEQERAEAEACRQQLATAFDGQTEELALAQRHIDAVEKKLAVQEAELQAAMLKVEERTKMAAEAEGKAATAEARLIEIAKRADDLKGELSRAHTTADQERQDSKFRLEAAESTISNLRDELRQRLAREGDVREELARLRGQADASERKTQTGKSDGKVGAPAKPAAASKSKAPNGA